VVGVEAAVDHGDAALHRVPNGKAGQVVDDDLVEEVREDVCLGRPAAAQASPDVLREDAVQRPAAVTRPEIEADRVEKEGADQAPIRVDAVAFLVDGTELVQLAGRVEGGYAGATRRQCPRLTEIAVGDA